MTITEAEILNALRGISDPASREFCRRAVNRLGVIPKVSASTLTVPEAVFSARGEDLPAMSDKAALCKSGARKGWPKGGFDADTIAALGGAVPTTGAKKPRNRKRTAAKDITGLHAADKALASGKVQWADDGALIPA